MGKPFLYGKLSLGGYFTNRTIEKNWLKRQIKQGINTTLIAPRRWGKSSLVQEVANEIQQKDTIFCFVDLYSVRNEDEFIHVFTNNIIRAVESNFEEAVRNLKYYFKLIIPQISISPDLNSEISIAIQTDNIKKNISEIIDLPQQIALKKKKNIVVCIDEFQNISFLSDGLAFQKLLRAHWQKHTHVTYVLYGSRRHMMLDFFTKSNMPFYKFGEILFLNKISADHWVKYICKRFEITSKKISEKNALLIANTMQCHPYYVQQYAQFVWYNTDKVVNDKSIQEALEELLDSYSLLYQKQTDDLTNYQLNYLKAMCNGENAFSSIRVLSQYNLGSSANIKRIKDKLQHQEIIDIMGKNISFNDPLFEKWLVQRFFKINLIK